MSEVVQQVSNVLSSSSKLSEIVAIAKRFPKTLKFVLGVLLFGFITYIRRKLIEWRRRRNQLPPGPTGWPILGDLLSFWRFGNTRSHFEYLKRLHAKYPSLCTINVGAHDIIIINDLTLLKQVMSREDMMDRDPAFIDFVGQDAKTHATQNGHEWLHNKKVTQSIINTYGIQNIDAMLHRCLENVLLPKIESNLSQPMKMHKLLRYSFFWTFFRLIYGKNESFNEDDQQYYDHNLEQHIKIRVVPLAFLSHVVGSWYNYITALNDKYIFYYFNNYQGILKKYWMDYNKDQKVKDCMLDLYQTKDITQHQIMNEIGNVMGGAIDNATNTTMYSLYNLGRLKSLQNELYNEIANVMGRGTNDKFDYGKVSQCQKLKAFIHESMRLLVPNSVGATRYCSKTFHVTVPDPDVPGQNKTYAIPKNTSVWWNIVSTTYDNKYWDGEKYDTKEFNINRWLDENGTKFVPRSELMTFGWGKRKCTGRLIVIKEFMHLFGTLIYNYEIHLGTSKYNSHLDDIKTGVAFSECHDIPVIYTPRVRA